ncbi:hypothetical protein BJX70DRAFT_374581 [Aspergillus crustosus]
MPQPAAKPVANSDNNPAVTKETPDNQHAANALCYDLVPDGDTVLILQDPPRSLPRNLNDVTSSLFSEAPIRPGARWLDTVKGSIRIRTSSKHLSLASPYFSRMLGGRFREGMDFKSSGHVEIPLNENRVIPFLLLMLIVHARTSHIPSTISLETLADVAVLVDYYGCYDAVIFYAKLWIFALQNPLPSTITRASSLFYGPSDIIQWLLISWVFGHNLIFQKMTQVLMVDSDRSIDPWGLPIPDLIIHKMNTNRTDFLNRLSQDLIMMQATVAKGCLDSGSDIFYFADKTLCTYAVLGALTKRILDMKITATPTDSSYPGVAIKKFLTECRQNMNSPPINSSRGPNIHDKCSLSRRIKAMLTYDEPVGLDLDAPEFTKLHQGRNTNNPQLSNTNQSEPSLP